MGNSPLQGKALAFSAFPVLPFGASPPFCRHLEGGSYQVLPMGSPGSQLQQLARKHWDWVVTMYEVVSVFGVGTPFLVVLKKKHREPKSNLGGVSDKRTHPGEPLLRTRQCPTCDPIHADSDWLERGRPFVSRPRTRVQGKSQVFHGNLLFLTSYPKKRGCWISGASFFQPWKWAPGLPNKRK